MAASSSNICIKCERVVKGRFRKIVGQEGGLCAGCHARSYENRKGTPDPAPVTPTKQISCGRPKNPIGIGSPQTLVDQFVREVQRAGAEMTREGLGHWKIKSVLHTREEFRILLTRRTGFYLIYIEKVMIVTPKQLDLHESLHRITEENVYEILTSIRSILRDKQTCKARLITDRIISRSPSLSLRLQPGLGLKTIAYQDDEDNFHELAVVLDEAEGNSGRQYWWKAIDCKLFVDEPAASKESCSSCSCVRTDFYNPPKQMRKTQNSLPKETSAPNHTFGRMTQSSDEAGLLSSYLGDLKMNTVLGLYLKNAFKHLKYEKGQQWDPALLSWAVNIWVHAGGKGYEAIRKSKHHDGLPLPHLKSLQRKVQLVQSEPGIDQTACKLFRNEAVKRSANDVVVSFDEIYLVSGLRLVRTKDGYGLIGYTIGTQRVNCTKIIHLHDTPSEADSEDGGSDHLQTVVSSAESAVLRNETDATQHGRFMIPVSPQEIDLNELPPPQEGTSRSNLGSSFKGIWHILPRWSESGVVRQKEAVKMALHFFVSSISANISSSIGYFEVSSVTHLDLHHYVNLAIMGVLGKTPADLERAERAFLLANHGKIEKPNSSYRYPSNSQPDCIRIVALAFDGSTHARTFSQLFGGSIRMYDRTGVMWSKRLADGMLQLVGFEHPLQKDPIICVGDLVHIIKRCRNAIVKVTGYLFGTVPPAIITNLVEEIHNETTRQQAVATFWTFHSARVGCEIFQDLIENDKRLVLSLSRLTESCINLTSRTKMSYPLAKRTLSQRVRQAIDALPTPTGPDAQITLMKRQNLRAYLDVVQVLLKLRKTIQPDRQTLVEEVGQTLLSIERWKTDNAFYHRMLLSIDEFLNVANKDRFKSKGTNHNDVFGFWHYDLYSDVKTTLYGFKCLLNINNIHTKKINTDVLESFFSTLRAGKGALTVDAHRNAYRQAKLCRIGDRKSYLDTLETRESTMTVQTLLSYYQAEKCMGNTSEPNQMATVSDDTDDLMLSSLSLPRAFAWTDVQCWKASLTPPENNHHRYIAGWLLSKELKKYAGTSAFSFFEKEKLAESTTEETLASNPWCSLVDGMLYVCHQLIGPDFVASSKLHGILTKRCEEALSTSWIVPSHSSLQHTSFRDCLRRFCAMFIADRLRVSGLSAKQGNMPMRVEVLMKKQEKAEKSESDHPPPVPPTRQKRSQSTRSFSCQVQGCSQFFPTKRGLLGHLKSHTQVSYRCQVCQHPAFFTSQKQLQEHRKQMHSTSKRRRQN